MAPVSRKEGLVSSPDGGKNTGYSRMWEGSFILRGELLWRVGQGLRR